MDSESTGSEWHSSGQWAHPEGAPGVYSNHMRAMLGDAEYENQIERNAETHAIAMSYACERAVTLRRLTYAACGVALGVAVLLIACAVAIVR